METTLTPVKSTAINDCYSYVELEIGSFIFNSREYAPPWGTAEKASNGYAIELELLKQFAKGIVLDIGANIGTHAVSYAKTANFVYAFEPQPLIYMNLCANIMLNNLINVKPVHCAIGAYSGTTDIPILDPFVENASASTRVGEGYEGSIQIPINTIDSFLFKAVNFVKIDVEGYEREVLRGMEETLLRCRPLVYVEVHEPSYEPEIKAFMADHGYGGDVIFGFRLVDHDGLPSDKYNHSYLFHPKEVIIKWV